MISTVTRGVRIAGTQTAVPQTSRAILDDGIFDDAQEAQRVGASIGVRARRIASRETTTSDLCAAAARSLMDQLGWAPDSVDIVVFVTQSSDYIIPATACVLQERLGLSQGAAFDVNLGCSGYVYGLWMTAQLLQSLADSGRPGRALLLAGDISTSKLRPDDRGTIPLFGDAGSATALERSADASPMYGVFGTDGRGAEHLIIRAGAMRDPLLPQVPRRSEEEEARLFKESRLHLNGAEVFGFTLRIVP
ncbi:MAG TPA: ketoacyl-ACP synthase III, partial [Azospirillaceae bacterium]|nr:ketoacyl-ACP synthase III [Azospirillaceae bacterium]